MKKSAEKKVKAIRTDWAESDRKRDENLCIPDDIKGFYDLSYGPFGTDNLLDIYMKKEVNVKQPTIFNIHGGAWVYGCKEIYQFYCMSLAKRGFTVVNINYRLAPEHTFPAALSDINQALTYIKEHADEYFVDPDRMILVGDSAGAQLASHYATIFTNKEFAKVFDFTTPDITIRALGLNCGIYDGIEMAGYKNTNDEVDEMFRLYLGMDSELSEKLKNQIDVVGNMTKDFPPSFVMSSEADFLLEKADPMYQHIISLGVQAMKKIYGSKDRADIGHVFHVNCNLEEARICNDDECAFFCQYLE